MISISHWGMFMISPPRLFVPDGWTVKDWDMALAECLRPDGIIEIVRR